MASRPEETQPWKLQTSPNLNILQPTPLSTFILKKLIVLQLVEKFPAFHRTPRFPTVFTTARQSMTFYHISLKSILTSYYISCLCLPNGLPSSSVQTKTFNTSFSPIRVTFPAYLIPTDSTLLIISGQYKSWSSPTCNFLQPSFNASILESNILPLSKLFLNIYNINDAATIILCSSFYHKQFMQQTMDGYLMGRLLTAECIHVCPFWPLCKFMWPQQFISDTSMQLTSNR